MKMRKVYKEKCLTQRKKSGLVSLFIYFIFLVYQISWAILSQSHPCRRTTVTRFKHIAWRDEEVKNVNSMGISRKMNVTARLEFEPTHFDAAMKEEYV